MFELLGERLELCLERAQRILQPAKGAAQILIENIQIVNLCHCGLCLQFQCLQFLNLAQQRAKWIPRVFDRYSHDRLLVSEFVDGPTLADQFDSGEVSYDALLLLFRIQGYFLFVKGEFHGDLHPGNIVWKNDQFWFLDNGWIETVPPRFSHGLFDMLAELARGSGTMKVSELIQSNSRLRAQIDALAANMKPSR